MENSFSENSSMDEVNVKILNNEQINDSTEEYRKLIDELKSRQFELEKTNDELRKEKEFAEHQLQKHIDFYNYAPSGYFTISRDGIILGLNQSASKFLGGQVDQLKGKRFNDFLHQDSFLLFSDFLLNVFESPTKLSCKVALRSPYNVPLCVLIEGTSLPNGVECLVDMVDISGRMKILHQLAESEMRYQQLLENLNEGVGIVDLDEIFTYANRAGEIIFGVAPGELRNRSLKEFLSSDQFSVIQEESEKRSKGENTRYELDIVTPNGVKKTIHISGSPNYDKNNNRIGTFGMFTDITDKKNDDRELQRRLKLELIISEISNDFVHLKRELLDYSVNQALQKIGSFAEVDRSYIFLFSDDGLFCDNTHEWCEAGIEPQIENLKAVPNEMLPWWMEKLHNYETIHVPLVANLPIEAQFEKDILEAQDIKSLLVIPLLTSDSVIGFLGFDSVTKEKAWQNEDILLLNMLGEILGSGFGRMKYEEELIRINTELEVKVEERTQRLKNLLEFNQGILRTIPDLLFRINKDGVYLDFYSSTNSNTYVPQEVFIGKSIREILPPDLADISVNAIENAFVSSEVIQFEYQLPIDGEEMYFENRIVAISENEALSIIRDITDRKLAEEALRTTTQNLTILIQNLHAGTLFEDETRHIYMVNQSFCDLFGINEPPEALVGFDCAVASENSKHLMKDPGWFIERIDEIILDGKILTSDELYLNDGRVFERDYIPILYNNDLLGHLWQYRDITARKLNERYAIIQRELGFSLAATTNIEQVLSQVIQSTMQIEGIHAVGVYLIDQQTGSLDLILYDGFSSKFVESVRQYKHEDVQFGIVSKGKPIYGFYDEIFVNSELFANDNLKQIGVIPIKHEGKIIGSVNIASRSAERIKYTAQISVEIIAAHIGGTLARINMENALRLSQRNFRLMFDCIDDFIFILNTEGKIIKANPVVERRLGYTREELQGMSVLEVHPPARREEAAFVVGEMLAGRLEVCPVPLCKKNGEFIPVETKVVFGKWDGADALYGISRDITERQEAEAALKMQSAAFESFDLPIIITDIKGRIQWANSSYFRLTGYTKEETLGKTEGELSKSGLHDDVFYDSLWNTILSGRVWNGELINHRKGGTLYHQELTITPVFNHKNELSSFIAIKIDITERKAIEEELRSSEERWHFALEGSGDGVWDWNILTNEVFFTKQWKAMLGYGVNEIENMLEEWEKRVFPDDLQNCLSDLDKHFNGETEVYMNEHRMLCKDGTYKWILDRGKVVEWTSDKKPMRIIGTHSDITPRKAFEEQLRKAIDKEKELNELKSRFVSTASHEFRTPLASILMLSDTLISYQQKMDQEKIAARLWKIKDNVLHLTNIVNDVLQLSKMQEGKIGFNPIEEDLVSLCTNIIEGFNQTILVNGQIDFKTSFKSLTISLDNRLIVQSISNLISNAIKYSEGNPVVKIDLDLEGNELRLSVKDNGIGIPEEDQKHLFTPFFRAENSSTIQGNGLGLSIVKESVQMHGGEVTFISGHKQGSIFTIHLPVSLICSYSLVD